MRAAIISHSLIHLRQLLFIEELRRQGGEVLAVFPEHWGDQHRKGGYTIYGSGIEDFNFMAGDAFAAINRFEPQIIYVMAEWWQKVSWQARRWARQVNAKLVFFFWENIRVPNKSQQELIASADLIICGNSECKEIVKLFARPVMLLQAGVDTNLFKPLNFKKDADFIFTGRFTKEKGIDLIRYATNKGKFKVLMGLPWCSYEEMTSRYLRARVNLYPSIDTPQWKEQNAPYTNLEALACGLSVITSDSRAIVEYLQDCEAVKIIPQNDPEALYEAMLDPPRPDGGREFVSKYSNEVVARKLIQVFETLVNP